MDTRFIKNEEGLREVQHIGEHEEQSNMKEKKIAIIVAGHVGHSQAEIVKLLNRHTENIDAEIVVIQTEVPHQKGSLEALVQEREKQLLISIEQSCKEISAMFFEEQRKPQHPNIYYTPKVQKTQLPTRKNYISRKK